MNSMDINTRIEIENETVKNINEPGQAGKVGLIGAFPSIDQTTYVFTSLSELRDTYGIVPKSDSEKNFDGALAAKRIFMEGIDDCEGASSISTVNICTSALKTSNISVTVNESGDIETEDDEEREVDGDTLLTYTKLKNALTKLAGEDIDLLFIAPDIQDAIPQKGETLYNGETRDSKGSINDVIDLILYYLNNVYSTQKPCNWISYLNLVTDISTGQETGGIASNIINVKEALALVKHITDKDTTNLATAGIYYQPLYINGTKVSRMSAAAHMTGFTASLPVTQSLTSQVIPGVTGVEEEAYFGEKDAGGILMNAGIQVIKSHNRLSNTWDVKNSIQPNGFDVNHIRAVTYLLKKYDLINSLGEETYDINIEALKAQLEAVNKEVLSDVPVIKEITLGTHKIISPWKIYLPVKITLYGTIDIIKLGVSMEISDESSSTSATIVSS
ncbi:hypothetical protein [Methanosphaera sp.]